MFHSLDFKHSVFSLTEWLSCSTFSSRPDACSSLDPSISEPFLWASYLIAWMFHFAPYFILAHLQWFHLFIKFYFNILNYFHYYIIQYYIFNSVFLQFLLWHSYPRWVPWMYLLLLFWKHCLVCHLCCISQGPFLWKFLEEISNFGGDILSSLYLRCLCFCDGT